MARSHSIHVVIRRGRVIGAFTVLHELETWQRDFGELGDVVVRVRDGHPTVSSDAPMSDTELLSEILFWELHADMQREIKKNKERILDGADVTGNAS